MPKVYLTEKGIIKAWHDTPTEIKGFNIITESYVEVKKSGTSCCVELTVALATELLSEKGRVAVAMAVTINNVGAAGVMGMSERGFFHVKERVEEE